jgi:hypothetical protein
MSKDDEISRHRYEFNAMPVSELRVAPNVSTEKRGKNCSKRKKYFNEQKERKKEKKERKKERMNE